MTFRLILSDLHLGRGRLREDGHVNPYEDFVDGEAFVEFLEYFSTGKYERQDAELIFNGDVFNLIQTAVEDRAGEWEITEDMILKACHDTIAGHPYFFEAINRFFSKRKRGKVIFIAGNHDQPILHPPVKEMIAKKISAPVEFVTSYSLGDLHCEHGHNMEFIHQYDPKDMWYEKRRKKILKMPWGSHFVIQLIVPLKEKLPVVDKIKPFGTFLKWGIFFKTGFTLKALLKMAGFYLRNRFLHPDREHRELFKLNIPAIIDGATHRNVRKYVSSLRKRGFRTVIMGHTHIPVQTEIDGVRYINTGTWIHMESVALGSFGMKWKKTFVLDEYVEGKRNVSLKVWRGKRREKFEILSM